MPSAFIDDGYTLTATIHSDAGLFDDFRIVYRRMAKSEQAEFDTETKDQSHKVIARIMGDWMAKKLVSWNLQRRDETTIEVTGQNCRQLVEPAFNSVWNHVIGYAAPDNERTDAEKNLQRV